MNLIHLETDRVLDLARAGASVRTIASMTGISKSTVSRILRGERKCDRNGNGEERGNGDGNG